MAMKTIVALPGEGIGPEVVDATCDLLMGTGLPLRLKQMGIPYEPDAAVERVSTAIDQVRALWAGERLPSATPGLPPIQPMFAPVHRVHALHPVEPCGHGLVLLHCVAEYIGYNLYIILF